MAVRRTFTDVNPGNYKAGGSQAKDLTSSSNPVKPTEVKLTGEDKFPFRPRAVGGRDNPYAKPSNIKCFRCLQPGHKSNECPSRHQAQFIEGDDEGDLEGNEVEADEACEEVEGDMGEPVICVVQKLLIAPRTSVNNQRHNLFRSKCTINGKVCDVVIDSGCTENIISRGVVQALQLKVTKNSNPYKIGWIKKGL